MKQIDQIKHFKNCEDQELFANKVIENEILNRWQIYAIWEAIDTLELEPKKLNPEELNYVVDNEGNEAIIPGLYNKYIVYYHIDPAYFADMLPLIYETRFVEKNKVGIIYSLCDRDNIISLFLNDNAYDLLKIMTPDEIKYTLTIGQNNRKRI